jgi:UDPglucose 6-dehydrogenase
VNLAVVGLGKLGSPLAAVLAREGNSVVGIDLNPEAVRLLAAGRAPVQEPGLQELVSANSERLTATADFGVVSAADVTFVIVPTPSTADGDFSLRYVLSAIEQIGDALAHDKPSRHVVVLTSTVMPGSCNGPVWDALERTAGQSLGSNLALCYSPQFIALGTVIHNMTHPDFVLVGESAPWAGDVLSEVMTGVVGNGAPIRRMSLTNAEITKIAVNTYVTTKISYANMISEICEALPGADVDVVTDAVGSDSRIGTKYLRGATAYGGPCFPRDNAAFGFLARSVGARADIAEATDAINRRQAHRVIERAISALGDNTDVRGAILGVAYKPDTNVTEESPGAALGAELQLRGFKVVGYDELGDAISDAAWPQSLARARSVAESVREANIVIVATPSPEFDALPDILRHSSHAVVVVDCWRQFIPSAFADNVELVHLGVGPSGHRTVAQVPKSVTAREGGPDEGHR